MTMFKRELVTKVLRPIVAAIGGVAAMWHGSHAATMWIQSREHRDTDRPLSDFFLTHFQMELTVAFVSMMAGIVAWRLFRPQAPQASPPEQPVQPVQPVQPAE
jgi:hypothetical protein